MCVCACVRACVCVFVRACVRVCVYVCGAQVQSKVELSGAEGDTMQSVAALRSEMAEASYIYICDAI